MKSSKAPLHGWIFVDNRRMASLNPDVPVSQYFAQINEQIVEPLHALNRVQGRKDLKSIRSFDGEDFRRLLLSGAILNYDSAVLTQLIPVELISALRDSLTRSRRMPPGFDISQLTCLGLLIEASETVLGETSISAMAEIEEQLKAETPRGRHQLWPLSAGG